MAHFPIVIGAALVLLFQWQPGHTQIVGNGRCPVVAVPAIDANIYYLSYNNWYEIFRYPSAMEKDLNCVISTFNSLQYSITGTRSYTGRPITITGSMSMTNSADISKWNLNYPGPAPEMSSTQYPFPTNLNVLGYQQGDWLVLWSCQQFPKYHIKYSWVLSTTKMPTQSQLETMLSVLDNNDIPRSDYIRTNQVYC